METKEKDDAFELVELGAVTEETQGTPVGDDDRGDFPKDLVIPE